MVHWRIEIMFQGYVLPVCTGSDMFTFPSYTLLQTIRTDAVFQIAREYVVIGPLLFCSEHFHGFIRSFSIRVLISVTLKQFLNFLQPY
jgi:hypothetical protein